MLQGIATNQPSNIGGIQKPWSGNNQKCAGTYQGW
jgi:hypothetical protein